jgi:hypothetical protein
MAVVAVWAPPSSLVDHAGVWEDARLGYLHEVGS